MLGLQLSMRGGRLSSEDKTTTSPPRTLPSNQLTLYLINTQDPAVAAMRLFHTESLELHEFFDVNIPPYAILSHTWETGEPTFQDVQAGIADSKAGYAKVRYAAEQARADKLLYVWIDTICIDKTNSTELFEAINSMYQWYADSEVCYGYLADVVTRKDIPGSRWFTRGWTLQELLAPAHLMFFNKRWQFLGKKSNTGQDENLRDLLLQGTGIAPRHGHVLDFFRPEDWTVAERMSWASKRTTTRREDLAYCLLGIFSVNMPLLYGEGDRAFVRLQEEIMRVSDDQSLFAWKDRDALPQSPSGLLARSPKLFSECLGSGEVHWKLKDTRESKAHEPYRMTNQGIHITLPVIRGSLGLYALLGYGPIRTRPGIVVKHIIRNEYARIFAGSIFSPAEMANKINPLTALITIPRPIVIRQRLPVHRTKTRNLSHKYWVDYSQLTYAGISLRNVKPPGSWNPNTSVVQPHPTATFTFGGVNDWLGDIQFQMTVTSHGKCSLSTEFEDEDASQLDTARSQLSLPPSLFGVRHRKIRLSRRGSVRTVHLSMSISRPPWRTIVQEITAEVKPYSSRTAFGLDPPAFPDSITLAVGQPPPTGINRVIFILSRYFFFFYLVLLFPLHAYHILSTVVWHIVLGYQNLHLATSRFELLVQGAIWENFRTAMVFLWAKASIEYGVFPFRRMPPIWQRRSQIEQPRGYWYLLQIGAACLAFFLASLVLVNVGLFWALFPSFYFLHLQIQLVTTYVPPEHRISPVFMLLAFIVCLSLLPVLPGF